MKLIKTVDAEGAVLCHDITQIIKGVTKDAVFRKGHIVTKEDIPVLLSVGKDQLYVWEKEAGMLHENDAAEAKSVKITLADMDITEPVKISYYILDETHDEELIREEIVTGKTAAAYLTLPNFTTYLIKIEKAEL